MIDYNAELIRLLKVMRKLDFPPAGPNWVRFIFDDVASTAKAMMGFAKGQPRFGYQPGYHAIKDRIELGIDLEAAIKVATRKGHRLAGLKTDSWLRLSSTMTTQGSSLQPIQSILRKSFSGFREMS